MSLNGKSVAISTTEQVVPQVLFTHSLAFPEPWSCESTDPRFLKAIFHFLNLEIWLLLVVEIGRDYIPSFSSNRPFSKTQSKAWALLLRFRSHPLASFIAQMHIRPARMLQTYTHL